MRLGQDFRDPQPQVNGARPETGFRGRLVTHPRDVESTRAHVHPRPRASTGSACAPPANTTRATTASSPNTFAAFVPTVLLRPMARNGRRRSLASDSCHRGVPCPSFPTWHPMRSRLVSGVHREDLRWCARQLNFGATNCPVAAAGLRRFRFRRPVPALPTGPEGPAFHAPSRRCCAGRACSPDRVP